jgi:hypothetical protein
VRARARPGVPVRDMRRMVALGLYGVATNRPGPMLAALLA